MIVGSVLTFSLVLALNLWLFFVWPKRSLADKFATVLKIVAVYTFTLGVLSGAGLLTPSLASALTSPNLLEFMGGNFAVLGIALKGLALAVRPLKTAPMATGGIEPLVLMLLVPIAFLGVLIFLIIVMPWSYIAYVIASVPVNAILSSTDNTCLMILQASPCFKAAVQDNPIAFKNFFATLFAGTIVFGLNFFRTLGERFGLLTHASKYPRFHKYLLWFCQGFVVFALVVTIYGGLWLEAMYTDVTGKYINLGGKIGEIYGVIVVIVLLIWLEILIIKRIRFQLKTLRSANGVR